ncbi:MAG: hypothetical protein ACREEL_10900 [Stellaceae bacterium]
MAVALGENDNNQICSQTSDAKEGIVRAFISRRQGRALGSLR